MDVCGQVNCKVVLGIQEVPSRQGRPYIGSEREEIYFSRKIPSGLAVGERTSFEKKECGGGS